MKSKKLNTQLCFCFLLICNPNQVNAQAKINSTDSFKNLVLSSFRYCEPIEIKDTIGFIKKGLEVFSTIDHSLSFDNLFFCFEPNYMNLKEPDAKRYQTEQLKMIRDVRWIFLFYVEHYILKTVPTKIDKFYRIDLIQLKGSKDIELYSENSSDVVIALYRKLIRAIHTKKFEKELAKSHKIKLLEYIGYQFEVNKIHSKYVITVSPKQSISKH